MNEQGYTIKPFGIEEIYDKRPIDCSEFDNNFKELVMTGKKKYWTNCDDIRNEPVLYRNLSWLYNQGFINKKESKQLYKGMKITEGIKDYMVCSFYEGGRYYLVDLDDGTLLDKDYSLESTLEDIRKHNYHVSYVKEIK